MVRRNVVGIPGSRRVAPLAARIGPSPPNESIQVTVYLRGPDTQVQEHLQRLAAQPVPERKHLTPAQFARRFGARPADIAAVRQFAANNGLHVVNVHRGMRKVVLGGTVRDMRRAFQVDLALYRGPLGVFRGHASQVHVPRWLAPSVVAVLGLDTRPIARPHFRVGRQFGRGAFRPFAGPAAAFNPPEVAALYKFPTGVDGSGQTIALIELGGGYRPIDLATYFKQLGVTEPNVSSVSVAGGTNRPTGNINGPDTEVDLDIEVSGSVAPGAKIVVYFAPNTDLGFVEAIFAAAYDQTNKPTIMSISWGQAEVLWPAQARRAMNIGFAAAAAMGITVFVAAGDSGSKDGIPGTRNYVDFPASSPLVVGCGGTHLQSAGGQITSETVWNDPGDGSTGGGVSDIFPVPAFQSAINPTSANPNPRHGRGVPDVSGDASPLTGYKIFVDGVALIVGGTSAVAPLWAGLLALIQQGLGKSSAPILPSLYQDPQGFFDITVGNNGGYSAGPGWDPCSGMGSPNGAALATSLGSHSAPPSTKQAAQAPTSQPPTSQPPTSQPPTSHPPTSQPPTSHQPHPKPGRPHAAKRPAKRRAPKRSTKEEK